MHCITISHWIFANIFPITLVIVLKLCIFSCPRLCNISRKTVSRTLQTKPRNTESGHYTPLTKYPIVRIRWVSLTLTLSPPPLPTHHPKKRQQNKNNNKKGERRRIRSYLVVYVSEDEDLRKQSTHHRPPRVSNTSSKL